MGNRSLFSLISLLTIVSRCWSQSTSIQQAQEPVYINAGGPTFIDQQNVKWQADSGFANRGSNIFSVTRPISEAAFNRETLYQTERWDPPELPVMTYTIPVLPGKYEVELHFSDVYSRTMGDGLRVFRVKMEGETVFPEVDIYKAVGGDTAYIQSTVLDVQDGVLNIDFKHITQNPKICAIAVRPVKTILLNAGGPTFQDVNGNTWITDLDSRYISGGQPFQTNAVISGNASIAQLYQSERNGAMTYTFNDIANCFFDVYLHFAEIVHAGSGLRHFNVKLQGDDVFDESVDLFMAAGGKNKALVEKRRILVTNNQLTIELLTIFGKAKINGIEIRPVPKSEMIRWTELAVPPTTTARHENSFVQAGNMFYLFGGRENPRLMDIYNPFTKTWRTSSTLTPQPFNHYQVVEHENLIWMIVGFRTNNFPNEIPAEHMYVYNPADDLWMMGAQIPAARRRGSAGLVIHDNKFYIVCGNVIGHRSFATGWTDEYDPRTGQWLQLDDAPRKRDHFHAVVFGNKMYAAGGRRSAAPENTFGDVVKEVDVFDLDTKKWLLRDRPRDLPSPRAASGTVVFEDKILLMGGESLAQRGAFDEVHELDPTTGIWSPRLPMNKPRHGTQAIVSGDGVYIAAGSPKRGGGNQRSMEVYNKDAPSGEQSVSGSLFAQSSMQVPYAVPTEVKIQHVGGNQGVLVTSMMISGDSASQFTIINDFRSPLLIPVGGALSTTFVMHLGNVDGARAQLNVAFNGKEMLSIELIGRSPFAPQGSLSDGPVAVPMPDHFPISDALVISDFFVVAANNDTILSSLDTCNDCWEGLEASIIAITFGKVGSVTLSISGPAIATFSMTENVVPYALFGDIEGNYRGSIFPSGTFTIKAQAFSESRGRGIAGPERTETFSTTRVQ